MAIPTAQIDSVAAMALDEAEAAAALEARAKAEAEAKARSDAEAEAARRRGRRPPLIRCRNQMTRPSMPNAKVLAGATRLKQTTRVLRDQWLSTEAGWGDVVRQRFEERYLPRSSPPSTRRSTACK